MSTNMLRHLTNSCIIIIIITCRTWSSTCWHWCNIVRKSVCLCFQK